MVWFGVLTCVIRYLQSKVLEVLPIDIARTAAQRKVRGHASCGLLDIGSCVAWAIFEHRVGHIIPLDHGPSHDHGRDQAGEQREVLPEPHFRSDGRISLELNDCNEKARAVDLRPSTKNLTRAIYTCRAWRPSQLP